MRTEKAKAVEPRAERGSSRASMASSAAALLIVLNGMGYNARLLPDSHINRTNNRKYLIIKIMVSNTEKSSVVMSDRSVSRKKCKKGE